MKNIFNTIFAKIYGEDWPELQHNFSIEEEIKGTGIIIFTRVSIESDDVFSNILTPMILKNLKFDGWRRSGKEDDVFHKVIEI